MVIRSFSALLPSRYHSLSSLQLSPLLAIVLIVLLHTPAVSFAWTASSPLASSHLTQQQRLLHASKNNSDENNRAHQLQWLLQNTLKSGTTQLFASSSDDNVNGGHEEDEATIMEIADALMSTTTQESSSAQPPANNEVNGFVQKAQQAWSSTPTNGEVSDIDINANTDTYDNNFNSSSDNDNDNNDEEANYLALAEEAWAQFFSDQLSKEEFLNMALDAWRDAYLETTSQDDDDIIGSQSDEVLSDTPLVEAEIIVEDQEEDEIVQVQEEDVEMKKVKDEVKDEQQWGVMSLFSGLFSKNKSNDAPAGSSLMEEQDEEDIPYGLRMKDSSLVDKNEEDIPYGLRMKDSSVVDKNEEDIPYGLRMKDSSVVDKNEEDIPYGLRMKDSSLVDENEEDIPYGLRMKSSSASVLPPPPPQPAAAAVDDTPISERGDDTLNSNVSATEGKSVREKPKMPPLPSINKSVTPSQMTNGTVKGRETSSFSGGNSLSSTTTPSSFKKSSVKVGIKGKFAAKKLDVTVKKRSQGKRGGLSFLKSDKISKGFNPVGKGGVAAEKTKASSVDKAAKTEGVQTSKSRAKPKAVDLPPVTELITDGMTAEEAERVRMRRLQTKEERALELADSKISSVYTAMAMMETDTPNVTPAAITEGMTAEEAERARLARLHISDALKATRKIDSLSKSKADLLTLDLNNSIAEGSEVNTTSTSTKLISDGMTADEAEGIRTSRLQTGAADSTSKPIIDGAEQLEDTPMAITEGMTAEEAECARMNRCRSNVVNIPTSTSLISDQTTAEDAETNEEVQLATTMLITEGMTAEEAERVRMNRLEMSVSENSSKQILDDAVQLEDTTAITEGMTAEEAERARISRYGTTSIDSRAGQVKVTLPTSVSRESETTEAAELIHLKENVALLESKINTVVNHIESLESRMEGLDRENLQLRQDNAELRKELDEMKVRERQRFIREFSK